MIFTKKYIYSLYKIYTPFSITKHKAKLFPHLTRQQSLPSKIYPYQYPKQIHDPNTSLIHKSRPIKYLTPAGQVPSEKDTSQDQLIKNKQYKQQKFKSPQNSYVLNVGILGPTNSGKSSIMSKLAHKVSAISPKAHTTSQIINSIKSYQINTQLGLKNIQIKYFDTPGIFENKGGFLSKGWKVLNQVDFVMLVIDSNKRFDDTIRIGIQRMQKHSNSDQFLKTLVLNKVDLVDSKRRFQTLISQIQKYGKFDKIFYTSATTQYGMKDLQQYLVRMAKKGKWQHPKQTKMLLTERQYFQELLKQAVFNRTYEQIPFNITIQCISIRYKSNGQQQIIFRIGVHNQNQQRMLIGKKGSNIEVIRNHLILQYVKMKKTQPVVIINVSIMNKTKRNYNQITEVVYPQNYGLKKTTKQLKQLQKILIRDKLSTIN